MTVPTYGVTPESLRAHHFPHLVAFSADSQPTATIVSEVISERAAELFAALAKEGISATAVDGLGATSAAYLWCRETLRLMAAVYLYRSMTGGDPAAAQALSARVDARLAALAGNGGLELGDASLEGAGPPSDGPTSHLNTYDIEVGTDDSEFISEAKPRLRRDDYL